MTSITIDGLANLSILMMPMQTPEKIADLRELIRQKARGLSCDFLSAVHDLFGTSRPSQVTLYLAEYENTLSFYSQHASAEGHDTLTLMRWEMSDGMYVPRPQCLSLDNLNVKAIVEIIYNRDFVTAICKH